MYNKRITALPPGPPGEMRFTMKAFLIVVGLIIFFVVAIAFISKQGGWQGGCSGNCSDCGSKCSTPDPKKKK